MRRHNTYITICLILSLVLSGCSGNRQRVKDGGEPSSNPKETTQALEIVGKTTTELLKKACSFLEIDSTPVYEQVGGDNANYNIVQLINPKNNEVFYLYLDLKMKEVFLLPIHGEATIKTASPEEIVFNVMGHSKEEDTMRFPYKLTCIKKDMLQYDFWGGFYGAFDRYWVKTGARTQFGTLYDSIELSQIVSTANSVQMLFEPVSSTGVSPLQKIEFDAEIGICEITILKCTVVSDPSIFIPEKSCISEIIYRADGDICIISIAYDTSVVDAYTIKDSVDKDGMPMTELILGSSADIFPSDLLESYSVKSVDFEDIKK